MTRTAEELVTIETLKYVGHTHSVTHAPEKVTGELVYGSDFELPDMLHARLLLSPIPHGRVKEVDAGRALQAPGVVGVFAARDVRGRSFCRCRLWPSQVNVLADEPLFADHVRFVGDRVGAVVATTRQAATAAAALVDVEYEELPPSFTPQEALADGAAPIHTGGNLIYEYELEVGDHPGVRAVGDRVGAEATIGDCVVTSTSGSTQRIHHGALEPHMCLADCDRSGKLTIWSPCQSAYTLRGIVADLFELPYSRVRVIKVPVGGSFGGHTEYMLEPVVAYLALALRRPIKLSLDREECLVATMSRAATTTDITTVISRDGLLRSFEADTIADAGAYSTSTPDYALVMTHKTPRLYVMPTIRHRARAVYSNGPVAGGMRGWGAPEICAPVEIHLDLAARRLGMDPVELRRRNLILPYAIDPATGMSMGDARPLECLDRGAEAFGWAERRARPTGRGRYRRGVGMACGAHKNGLEGEGIRESSTMTLKMNEDGSLTLVASLHELGCGVLTSMRVIVAEVLDVDPGRVEVGEADTDTTPFDFGTFASRMIYVSGGAAKETAEQLKEVLLDVAAELSGIPRERLVLQDGRVCDRDDPDRGVPYSHVATRGRLELGKDVVVTTTHRCPSNPGSYSVQFAEVEVDTLSGLTRVTDVLAVGDVGMAINRGMVEDQFRGAVQMGIGYALSEDMPLDAAGRVPSGGFKTYHMVNAPDMPEVRVLLVEHSGDDGPYGAKSVGEIATVPTAPAVVNAINHALNTSICDLPVRPERIIEALYGADVPPAPATACDSACA